jgi:type I restriction enzyme S subunit
MTEAQRKQLNQTAALFPDELVESELGEIPRGWEIGSLGKLCSTQGGYAFKSKLFNDETGNPVVKIKNIKEGYTVDIQNCQYLSDENSLGKERYELSDGDYVIAMTGATVGKTGIVVSDSDKVLLNQRVAKFTSEKFDENINWFIHSAFLVTNLRDKVENIARGSAQPNISASGIESLEMIIPSNDIIKKFLKLVDPLFQKWIISTKESKELMELRDTLLPKLISGEIGMQNKKKQ